jgi:transposase
MWPAGRASIYACCEPTDMRKGFEGLSGVIRDALKKDPLSGSLFLFANKRRTHAKVLWFDGSGVCVLSKRIERGRFAALWKFTDRKTLPLKRSELELFLEGSHLIGRFQVSPPVLSDSDLAIRDRT